MNHKPIEGFSKLSKQHKIDWLINEYLEGNQEYQQILQQYWNEILRYRNYTKNFQKTPFLTFICLTELRLIF